MGARYHRDLKIGDTPPIRVSVEDTTSGSVVGLHAPGWPWLTAAAARVLAAALIAAADTIDEPSAGVRVLERNR